MKCEKSSILDIIIAQAILRIKILIDYCKTPLNIDKFRKIMIELLN